MVHSWVGVFCALWKGRTQLRWVDTLSICLPLQEDCHYLLYPSVGMLSDASHKLHVEMPRGQLAVLLLIYLEMWSFVIGRLFRFFIGVPMALR